MADPIFSPDGKWHWNGTEWIPVSNPSSIETHGGNQNDFKKKSPPTNGGFWNDIVSNSDQEVVIDSRSVSQKIKQMEDEISSLKQEKHTSEISNLFTARQLITEGKWQPARDLGRQCLDHFSKHNDDHNYARALYILGKCDYMQALSRPSGIIRKGGFEDSEKRIKWSLEKFNKHGDEESVLECMEVLRDIAQARLAESSEIARKSINDKKKIAESKKELKNLTIDVGSRIGLELDDEDVYGVILEFNDEENTVTIEEDDTGDLVTGDQNDMFSY